MDNAFLDINSFQEAQTIADDFNVERIHRILDDLANRVCPIILAFQLNYYWRDHDRSYGMAVWASRIRD